MNEDLELVMPDEALCLLKLGVIKPTTDQFDAYLIMGTVMNDAAIWEKQNREPRVPHETVTLHGKPYMVIISWTVAIERMTPAERTALRDRVLGVVEFAPVTAIGNTEQLSHLEENDDESEVPERI